MSAMAIPAAAAAPAMMVVCEPEEPLCVEVAPGAWEELLPEPPELLEVVAMLLQVMSVVPAVVKRVVLVPHPFASLTETASTGV